jgi:nucleoside-diphosphate-sugar epimerase
MKVLVTGHHGYIGSVLAPMLERAGHDVVGFDTFLYQGCDFGPEVAVPRHIRKDLRDVEASDLVDFDAVIHLAALSNDPVSSLNPEWTREINDRASVRLARASKEAGVPRFLFSSSCSLYGQAGDGFLAEDAAFNPITPYGESKVNVEREVAKLADATFSPTFLRNATAYGASPRLRADLMVNSLVGYAYLTGEVRIQSDGTPWRPLVHVEDISSAFLAVLQAPRDAVHGEAFNVGRTEENFQVRAVADMVRDAIRGSTVTYAEGGGPDPRCYRINADKLRRALPEYRPRWTVREGIEQLRDAYESAALTREEFLGSRYQRIERIRELLARRQLDANLRWT